MPRVQWLWVLVGVVFIYGVQLLLGLAGRAFGAGVEQLVGLQALFLAFTLFTFFFGGFVVGLFSPGTTVIEPPLAGFLLAFVGGWIGEKMPTPARDMAPRRCSGWRSSSWLSGCPREWSGWVPVWLAALVVVVIGGGSYWPLTRT